MQLTANHIRPLDDHLLVRPLNGDLKSKGGIVMPDTAKKRPCRGIVVAVGPGTYVTDPGLLELANREKFNRDPAYQQDDEDTSLGVPRRSIAVKEGAHVLYKPFAGYELDEVMWGERLIMLHESELLAELAVAPEPVTAA